MKTRMKFPGLAVMVLSAALLVAGQDRVVQAPMDPPYGRPDAVVDLATDAGAALVGAQWRYTDVNIVQVDARGPGPDLKPSGEPIKTYDYSPKINTPQFETAAWRTIAPTSLTDRRSTGKVCFNWYRVDVTIPPRISKFATKGATVAFETVIDDYAEVWVDGKLTPVLGQTSGGVVRGFNAPNRVILTHDASPGQTFHIAVFGINAPISASPNNFIWVKSATLDFYGPKPHTTSHGTILKTDPALDEIVSAEAKIEKVAEGFLFTEGPVWHPDGYLLFSDPNNNTIYRWTPDGDLAIFLTKSGYTGFDIGELGQPGSNGLTLDSQGRLTINQHGNRRVVRLEKNGVITVLADRYQGKRLNSPNDLVYRSDGALYFTDPPFGLPKFFDDPRKELSFSGVFCLINGELKLVSTDLKGPNGLAFSPDEKFLYVTNWDEKKKVVMRYDVHPDGTLSNGKVFFDMTAIPGEQALDGMKVDERGNLYVSGPGGLWIISPEAIHLGTIKVDEQPANLAWGDADGKTLYLTARTGLYRIRVNVAGIRPPLKSR